MSWILARDGRPPFVLSPDNAVAYFDPSAVIKGTRKTALSLLVRVPRIKQRLARFLQEQADPNLLCAAEVRPGPSPQPGARETSC
jgi:hypothetical protein